MVCQEVFYKFERYCAVNFVKLHSVDVEISVLHNIRRKSIAVPPYEIHETLVIAVFLKVLNIRNSGQ